jgi:AraC family transcriptional regulator, regulatory protein of adaptative response / methylated-DNA-[protein]-cysteine methyltransferase
MEDQHRTDMAQMARDYQRVEQAIRFLEASFRRQPTLEEIAESAGLSEFHFQRLFGRWVGISPKRFLQFLTKEYAKTLLEHSEDVLGTAYAAGLSGPSRLHDLFVSCEAMTPGEYRARGSGMKVSYGFHPSPFGEFMVAVTGRGVCALRFVREAGRDDLLHGLASAWPRAERVLDQESTAAMAESIFSLPPDHPPAPLHLYVKGTNFQIKVWEALLRIPLGKAVTYEDIARHIGMPGASRAVGNAVGANPIPFLIPCHRVLRKAGEFGNYGEGPQRKKAILGWEASLGLPREAV